MAGEIIRMGDSTSHGGKVLEGSQTDICMGKPIAYIGHKTHCPKCRGDFAIVEGVMTTTLYGKGVAVAGMKTACGAVLVASQFTDTVERAGGGASRSDAALSSAAAAAAVAAASAAAAASSTDYDLHFHVLDNAGKLPLTDWPYVIELSDGTRLEGRTDHEGKTDKIGAKQAADATLHVFEPVTTPINPHWDQ